MRLRPPALLLSLGILVIATAIAPGCDRANPLYRGPGAGGVGQAGDSGAAGDTGGAGMLGSAGAGGGTPVTACNDANDCATARGAPPCGAWACRAGKCAVEGCPNCVDQDGDGFGVGVGCAGPDCNDADPAVLQTAARACYDGAPATMAVGTCRGGTQRCADGLWAGCTGEVLPAGEACNGLDDDCNGKPDDTMGTIGCGLGECARTAAACAAGVLGVCQPAGPTATLDDCDGKDNDCDGAIDEDCATACVRVAQNGDDMGNGSNLRPLRSIQAAIAYAAAAANRPKALCVAGGATCADASTYITSEGSAFNMANGISVYGNYEATTWTRCPLVSATGVPTLNVTIQPRTNKGVIFPATVTTPTTLDGVRVARFTNTPLALAGVTVEGAKQVVISNIVIDDVPPSAMAAYGVNLTNGAEALITRSSIMGGAVMGDAIAIRSVGSKPTIRDNCATIDPATGRCTSTCAATALGLRGRAAPATAGNAMAVDLINSPGAVVERNTMCGTQGSQGFGVHIAGVAAGTVIRGNTINATGGTARSHGIWMDGCADAAPWIVGNELIQADGTGAGTRISAVGVAGPCHPVIDGNARITGAGEAAMTTSVGVSCGAAANVASRCTIVGNKLIQGAAANRAALSMGVVCEAGACGRIAGNKIIGQGGATVIGLALSASGPFVERNDVQGGCGTKLTTALLAEDAWSRIENNLVRGGTCPATLVSPEVNGLHVHVGASGNELDVHSNTIEAGGLGACLGAAAGIGLGAGEPPKSPVGIFRNNLLRAGACTIAHSAFLEDTVGTSPRLFENNNLDPTGVPTALYVRNVNQLLTTIAAVNALPRSVGNLSVDSMFVAPGDAHLGAASACANAGTTAGAPKNDFDGKPRDAKPDIGAFER